MDALFEPFTTQATVLINWFAAGVRALPVSFAFGAGMIATVNPCGFVMLPSFAAFYLASNEGQAHSVGRRLLRASWLGLLVSLAFIVTFGIAGFVTTLVGRQLIEWARWMGLGIGVVLLIFGGLGLTTRVPGIMTVSQNLRVTRSRSVRGVLAFGFAYAVVSLGCTLPIFMAIVGSTLAGAPDYVGSVRRFVEYGAGMGLVLALVASAVAVLRERAARIGRVSLPGLQAVANIALMFTGAYVSWYWWRALG